MHSIGEKEVAHFLSLWAFDTGAVSQAANLFECSGDAVWISRELDGRSVGEEFSLPGHGALDELAEKDPHITNNQKRDPEGQNGTTTTFLLLEDRVPLRIPYPIMAITRMPFKTPISRMFRRMSPLRM